MKISIITPNFNQGRYIEDCILSVKNQTYQNIEHLIFDNESTDETNQIIHKYLGTYPIVYYREKDQGQAHAINKGFALAKGDIVCWLNADDYYENPFVLKQVVDYFINHPDIHVLTGNGYFVDEKKVSLQKFRKKIKPVSLKTLSWIDPFLQPATFWLKNTQKLDENLYYTFDWKLFFDFMRAGRQFGYVDLPLACYRWQDGGKTYLGKEKRVKEILKILKHVHASNLTRIVYYLYYLLLKFILNTKLNRMMFFFDFLIRISLKTIFGSQKPKTY